MDGRTKTVETCATCQWPRKHSTVPSGGPSFFSTQLGRFKGGEIRDGAGGSKLDSDIFRCGGFCMKKNETISFLCVHALFRL